MLELLLKKLLKAFEVPFITVIVKKLVKVKPRKYSLVGFIGGREKGIFVIHGRR